MAALIGHEYRATREELDAALESKIEALQGHAAKLLEVNTVLLDRMAERFDRLPSAAILRDQATHHAWLASLHAKHRDVLGLSVIGPGGAGIAHSEFYPVPAANASDRDYFRVHKEDPRAGIFVSEPLRSRVANEPGFTLSRRRGRPGDSFDGIYNASIRAGHLMRFWQQSLQHGPGEVTLLARLDGALLARYPQNDGGTQARLPAQSALMRLMSTGDEGIVETTSTIDAGRQRIVIARRIEGFPIYIAYGLDRELAFASWRRQSLTYGAIALATTVLLFALALLVRRRSRSLAAANARLTTTEGELREAGRRKDEFLAALAHELRNPLAAIANSTFILQRARGAVERDLAMPIIARQVRQLQRMADDLLDAARSAHGKISLERQPVNLRVLLEGALAAHRERHGERVRFDFAGAAAWVSGDPVRLLQVFDNLLDNAVKYGGRRVQLGLRVTAGIAEADISDDGEGIEPGFLPRLFEPFSQGPQALDRARGGLGLGLALARRMVELHGGTIEAHSAGRGRGSVFRVRLPATEPPAASATPPAMCGAGGRRVLVVEDQADARESLRALLELDGHQVVTASSGLEALARAREQRPDIAFIDIGLPGMDGYELARRLRADGQASGRLVALTGYGQESDKQLAGNAGFDLHLTKPVSYEALQEAIVPGSAAVRRDD